MSKTGPDTLATFLAHADPAGCLLITDFDGTLYRGLFPAHCRGIANADLALFLTFPAVCRLGLFCRRLLNLFRLARFERAQHRRRLAGKINLTEMDRAGIEWIVEHFLRDATAGELESAAAKIARLCCADAWPCLRELQAFCQPVIVSKSFDFVLAAAAEEWRRQLGTTAEYRGVQLTATTPRHIDRQGSILTRADKQAYAEELLRARPDIERALLVGDTEDDLGLRAGALSVLEPHDVFFVAIHPKDERIGEQANVICRGWTELKGFAHPA